MDSDSPVNKARVDYHQRLSATVGALGDNSPQTRHATYDAFREALRQKALSGEITSYARAVESVALEKAIEEIERQFPQPRSHSASEMATALLQRLAQLNTTPRGEDSETRMARFDAGPMLHRLGQAVRFSAFGAGPRDHALNIRRQAKVSPDAAILLRLVAAFIVVIAVAALGIRLAQDINWPQPSQIEASAGPPSEASEEATPAMPVAPQEPPQKADLGCPVQTDPTCGITAPVQSVEQPPEVRPSRAPARSKIVAAQAAFEAGTEAVKAANPTKALSDFGAAIKSDPTFAEALVARGQVHLRRGDLKRAIADFDTAITLDPQHALALKSRGAAHQSNGETGLALADFSRAIELATDPDALPVLDLFNARRSRARLYETSKRNDDALSDLSAIIDDYQKTASLPAALSALGRDGAAAIATIYERRAALYVSNGKPEAALSDLSAAIDLGGPRTSPALIARAKLYESLGMTDEAANDRKRAGRLDVSQNDVKAASPAQ